MTHPYVAEKDLKKRTSQVREQAGSVHSLIFTLLVLLWSIPTIIALTQIPFDARAGLAFMKLTNVCTVLAMPFSTLLHLGAAPGLLLDVAFPNVGALLEARFPEIASFASLYQGYVAVPDIVYVLPFIFTVLALVYLGYKLPAEASGFEHALRFALGKYLGSLAAFVVFWGIAGALAGMWDAGFIIGQLFVTWGSGWVDLLLWLGLSVFLVQVGKLAAGRRPPAPDGAGDLISALQQPVPRRFSAHACAEMEPAPVANAVTVAAVPAVPVNRYCEFCGSKLDTRGKFCSGCGVVLDLEPAHEPAAPMSSPPATAAAPAPVSPATATAPVATSRPAVYIDIPAPAPSSRRGIAAARKPGLASEREVEEWERALLRLDGMSVRWAVLFMTIGVLVGLLSLVFGSLEPLAYAVLSLPFGIIATIKDKYMFSDLVFQRNYSSRGVDLIIWGLMGSLCSGAGLLLFAKGVLMVLITQNTPAQYPRLTEAQWRARVFQSSMTAAGPLMLFSTIAAVARFATFNPFSITWAAITTIAGILVYYAYTRFLRPEIVRGNLQDLDVPLIVAGIVGLLVNLGGALILMQGIMIAIQKDEKHERDAPAGSGAGEPAPAGEPAGSGESPAA